MVGFPNKPMGFPTKNDQHLGCLGVPPFKETPKNGCRYHRHFLPHAWPRPRPRWDATSPRKGDAFDARLSFHYGLPDTHCLHFGHVPRLPPESEGGKAWGLCIWRMFRNIWNEDLLQIRLVCKYLVVYIHANEYIGSDISFLDFMYHVS